MNLPLSLILFAILAAPSQMAAQVTGPDQQSSPNSQTSGPQQPASPSGPQAAQASDRPASWKLLLPNIVSDQRRIWSFPSKLTKRQNWIPVAAVAGTTAALFAFDPVEASYFRSASSFNRFNHVFTGNATVEGTIAAPITLYAVGLIRRDPKMQRTALLAAEAVADAEIVTTVLKDVTKRVRPAAIPSRGNFADSWFESGGSVIRGDGSFPSGHTIAAFSVATVVARRYGNHRWVPYAAYGLAALVGFSRLSLSAHFLSDVFVGGAFGYSISRFTVLRQ